MTLKITATARTRPELKKLVLRVLSRMDKQLPLQAHEFFGEADAILHHAPDKYSEMGKWVKENA